MKLILSLFLGLMLCGCVLQSKAPNFAESDGKPLLGAQGGTYAPYSLDKGVWKTEDEAVFFRAVAHHYEFTEKTKTTAITFIPISGDWWVAQFQEGTGPAVYVLANKQPDAIYIHPIACKDLPKDDWSKQHVTFDKDDCFLAGHTKIESFKGLIAAAGPRSMKMVLKK